MTYVISVATNRNLDLTVTLPSELANFVRLCLRDRRRPKMSGNPHPTARKIQPMYTDWLWIDVMHYASSPLVA
jgi:hypothetical protein